MTYYNTLEPVLLNIIRCAKYKGLIYLFQGFKNLMSLCEKICYSFFLMLLYRNCYFFNRAFFKLNNLLSPPRCMKPSHFHSIKVQVSNNQVFFKLSPPRYNITILVYYEASAIKYKLVLSTYSIYVSHYNYVIQGSYRKHVLSKTTFADPIWRCIDIND